MTSPPSYLKPQLQSLASLPVGVPELSATAALPIMQPVLLPKTPRKRTGPRKGFKSLGFPIISNSPDNTYDMALLLRVSPQTPGHPLQEAHYDILFVRSLSSSAVECVASIRICLTTTRKTSPFRLFPHLMYRPLSQRTERKVYRMYERGTSS